MSAMEPERPDEGGDDILAAEFVLGVLPGAEQASLARRVEIDPHFARLVAEWDDRLLPLADGFAAVDLPPLIKQALDRRLFGVAARATRPGLWGSLALWRGLAAAATVAVLTLLALPRTAPDSAPGVMALLSADTSDVRYMAVFDPNKGTISLAHVSGAPQTGRVFQLWVAEGSNAPVSLGVIPPGAETRISLDAPVRPLLTDAAHMAISLEPPGGSPTGQPTGAVVAVGDLHDI